ncbi:MAG: response regulator [Draconibacterium sp.]|nr:response regulator [Draconibacterium sp.]
MSVGKNILIYVVEDNKLYNKMICQFLEKSGYKNVKTYLNGKDCVNDVAKGESPDVVIQDYFLEDSDGIAVLQAVKKKSPNSEFVFLTANENMDVAINSIKYGAYDYIIKDSDIALKKVVNKIEKITKMLELKRRNKIIKQAMIASLFIVIAIILFALLHVFFDAFGWQQ